MEFQIKQKYRDGSCGYIYFEANGTETIEVLSDIAIKEAVKDWESIDPALYFSAPEKPKPTIKVREWADGKTVKNGIHFKCRWR